MSVGWDVETAGFRYGGSVYWAGVLSEPVSVEGETVGSVRQGRTVWRCPHKHEDGRDARMCAWREYERRVTKEIEQVESGLAELESILRKIENVLYVDKVCFVEGCPAEPRNLVPVQIRESDGNLIDVLACVRHVDIVSSMG